jgi:2-iminobutanoate/2-iminopropanoate deaminase
MHVSENTSRRSAIGAAFASAAAVIAGLFASTRVQAQAGEPLVKKTSTDDAKPGSKPPLFSGWVTYGNLVFIAGKGYHEAGDITVHTKAVIDSVEAELKRAGSSMDKVLKVNVYLNDLKDYDGMNAVFRGRFGTNPPVRTTVACAGGIPGNSLVEIDCIAYR